MRICAPVQPLDFSFHCPPMAGSNYPLHARRKKESESEAYEFLAESEESSAFERNGPKGSPNWPLTTKACRELLPEIQLSSGLWEGPQTQRMFASGLVAEDWSAKDPKGIL